MKILVVGSGGREHALVWKLAQSKKVSHIWVAPGNAGTAQIAENISIDAEDVNGLLNFAENKKPDLTIVGPEVALVKGIADRFLESGLKVFGPTTKGAIFEGSKAISKLFMEKYNIPTAKYKIYENENEAISGLELFSLPVVVKADGLAAGKGVIICETYNSAVAAINSIMAEKQFGEAGNKIVIEEFLEGTEASLLCFVAGNKLFPMESARDYKKAYDNDKGLNTGGMGCFSPNPVINQEIKDEVKTNILNNISEGFLNENIDFRGILFIGLMITNQGVKVLEFNVRFGDPETQVIIPRLESDLVDICLKTIDGTLTETDLLWSKKQCMTLVIASGGYPENYAKGKEIKGLETVESDVTVFHAGTKKMGNKVVTSGGRVLNVTALGDTLEEARQKVYSNAKKIKFEGMFFRNDIAAL